MEHSPSWEANSLS